MQYSPSENEFKGTIMNIIEQFQECALAVPNLIPDALFHSFTRYRKIISPSSSRFDKKIMWLLVLKIECALIGSEVHEQKEHATVCVYQRSII